ncbi:hypothetical protein ACFWRV_07675 [Streptomyces sp. NPDC058576]|uniref:hypothetical protein n=1 Tax=Streptomyces sp. NPDC058576 TaxID=3346547 RepID=UPI0036497EB9
MKKTAILMSAVVLAGGLVCASGGTAQAAPGNCTTWTSGNNQRFAHGHCATGTGEYRVKGRCDHRWSPDPYLTTAWVRVGQTTTGDCRDLGVDHRAHSLRLEFR